MASEDFQKLMNVITSSTAEKFASLAANMEEKLASQQAQTSAGIGSYCS